VLLAKTTYIVKTEGVCKLESKRIPWKWELFFAETVLTPNTTIIGGKTQKYTQIQRNPNPNI